MKSNMKNSQF